MLAHKPGVLAAVGDMPPRPPNFCAGCPERPVFAAIKLAQRDIGPTHISADIGCHSFATFAPFSLGNSILGYGMSLASAAAVAPNMAKRPIAVMGGGGFWHNGLITGVGLECVQQRRRRSHRHAERLRVRDQPAISAFEQRQPLRHADRDQHRENAALTRVHWPRTVRTYSVGKMAATLKEAMRTAEKGLKVIIADGECVLARQRW